MCRASGKILDPALLLPTPLLLSKILELKAKRPDEWTGGFQTHAQTCTPPLRTTLPQF